ncbi:MAG: peptidylprolyl isomerase [Thermodesulfobacteriota bacterium]
MSKVKQGKFVQVHYTGTLQDGSVFDSSEGRTPLEFQVGGGQVISGFDKAVMNMEINEEKTFTLTSEQAYGPPRDDLHREFPLTMLGDEQVQVGQDLWFNSPRGPVSGKVLAVGAENFTVDFNHPLAGKDLNFRIKVVGITDQPTQATGCSCSHGTEGSCGPNCG